MVTNDDLLRGLSEGLTVKEIAFNGKIKKRTLEARLIRLRDRNLCKNITQLVATWKDGELKLSV